MCHMIRTNQRLALVLSLAICSISHAQQRIVQRFPGSAVSFTLNRYGAQQPTITVTETFANGAVTRTLNTTPQRMTVTITYTTDYRRKFQTKAVSERVECSPQANPLATPVDQTDYRRKFQTKAVSERVECSPQANPLATPVDQTDCFWQPAVFRSMTNMHYHRGAAEVPVLYGSLSSGTWRR